MVGVLEVHAFASGVGRDQHTHVRIGPEECLEATPLIPVRAAMDGDDCLAIAEYTRDLVVEVVQRIAMFGKNGQNSD